LDTPLEISLVVTGIGMLALFLALAFLYGLMILLTTVTRERTGRRLVGGAGSPRPAESHRQGAGADWRSGARRRAAVVAVALARAEREAGDFGALDSGGAADLGSASPWWALHHSREWELGPRTRRRR